MVEKEEMSNKLHEQLYFQHEHLTEATLFKMFHSPTSLAKSKRMEFDDLLQFARIGLWKACINYNENKRCKFTTYAINCIRWSVVEGIEKESEIITYSRRKMRSGDRYKTISIDKSINDKIPIQDELTSNENIETEVINKIEADRLLNLLTDHQKKVVRLKLKGKSNKEISEILGSSQQNISKTLKRVNRKMKARKDN